MDRHSVASLRQIQTAKTTRAFPAHSERGPPSPPIPKLRKKRSDSAVRAPITPRHGVLGFVAPASICTVKNHLRLRRLLSEYNVQPSMRMKFLLPAALTAAAALSSPAAAPPELKAEDLPRVPPVETTNVFSTFQIKKGFHLEIAAAEPLVL